jgi:PIN domain nuclease of toxin-antitoxin system
MLNLDTHILIFALIDQLRPAEKALLAESKWGVSAIVFWEIAKLFQLGRIEVDLEDPAVLRVLAAIHVWPIDIEVCRKLRLLDFRGDPADELIAATSLAHRAPLVTRDGVIRKSKLVPLAL